MYNTLEEAQAALQQLLEEAARNNHKVTPQELFAFADNVSAQSAGRITVFYSGADDTLRQAVSNNPDSRMIGKNSGGRFYCGSRI